MNPSETQSTLGCTYNNRDIIASQRSQNIQSIWPCQFGLALQCNAVAGRPELKQNPIRKKHLEKLFEKKVAEQFIIREEEEGGTTTQQCTRGTFFLPRCLATVAWKRKSSPQSHLDSSTTQSLLGPYGAAAQSQPHTLLRRFPSVLLSKSKKQRERASFSSALSLVLRFELKLSYTATKQLL